MLGWLCFHSRVSYQVTHGLSRQRANLNFPSHAPLRIDFEASSKGAAQDIVFPRIRCLSRYGITLRW